MTTDGQSQAKWYHGVIAAVLVGLLLNSTAPWWTSFFKKNVPPSQAATPGAAGPAPADYTQPAEETEFSPPPAILAPSLQFAIRFLGVGTPGNNVNTLGTSATIESNDAGRQIAKYTAMAAGNQWLVQQTLDQNQLLGGAMLHRDWLSKTYADGVTAGIGDPEAQCAEGRFMELVTNFVADFGQPRVVHPLKVSQSRKRTGNLDHEIVENAKAVEWPLENDGLLALTMYKRYDSSSEVIGGKFFETTIECSIAVCIFPKEERTGCQRLPGITLTAAHKPA